MVEKLAIIVFLVLHPEETCSGYETSGADPVVLFVLSIFFYMWHCLGNGDTFKKQPHGTAILIRENDLFSRSEHQKKGLQQKVTGNMFRQVSGTNQNEKPSQF